MTSFTTATPARAMLIAVATVTAGVLVPQPVAAALGGDQPAIVVAPTELYSVQAPDEAVTHEFVVGNEGGADLDWTVLAEGDEQFRLPVQPTTPVEPVAPELGGTGQISGFPGHGGRPGRTVTPPQPPTPPGQLTFSHSPTQSIVAGQAVACSPNLGLRTHATGFLRHFTLADFGIVGDLQVSAVSFGVEILRGEATGVTVNLYTLVDPDAPFRYDNFDLIGTTGATLAEQTMTLVQVPVTGTVPAGGTLVVEVAAPNLAQAGFYLAAHPGEQTAPSYLRAEACGLPEPAPLAALGKPATQLLMNVTGTAEIIRCEAPAGTPWLSIDPQDGTVAPAGTQTIEVELDAAGLADGEVRTANLCLGSNDPKRPRVVVQVQLTVVQPVSTIMVAPESITAEQAPGEATTHPLTISNVGDAPLAWEIGQAPVGCDSFGEVSWLGVAPGSGVTSAGEGSDVTATLDSTGLVEGEYQAVLCVDSDDPDRPRVEVPVTLAVGPDCDRTIVGIHPGPLTVTEGVTCLAPGSYVQGEVNVFDGAGLIARSATVQGPLSTFGATVVELTASQVTGPISIRGTTGSAAMSGTQVVGSVLVVNNQPADAPLLVSANIIVGSLFCTGNRPAPVDGGVPNTVLGGMKLDQCAGL